MKRHPHKLNSSAGTPVTEKNDKTSEFKFSWWTVLYIMLGIVLLMGVGFLSVFLASFLFRRGTNESQDSLKILTQDLSEGGVPYPIHVQTATRTIDFCKTQQLTYAKAIQLFKNAKVTVHFNGPDKAPKDIQQIMKTYFGGLKVSQKSYSKFTATQVIDTLQRDFVFAVQSAHPVAQRLISIFFSSNRPGISIYNDSPEAMLTVAQGYATGGRYLIANNTIRFITKGGPSSLIAHEGTHGGAVIATYGNSLWQKGEFSYPITPAKINHLMSNAFPCDQKGFFELWTQEVNQVLAMGNSPKLLELAQEFTPRFQVWLSEKNLVDNSDALLINSTVTLSSLPKAAKLLVHSQLSQYEQSFVPTTDVNPDDYYQRILLQRPVVVVDTNRDTEFPGVSAIQVTPLAMPPTVKAGYLLRKFYYMKDYANRFTQSNGHCQEAFAVTFELNSNVITKALPKSMAYLEKRLDEYERSQCPQVGL